VQDCGNCDGDSCNDWCYADDCSISAQFCNGGVCVDCLDDCTAGSQQCMGDTVQDCIDCDADVCLDWCDITDCTLTSEVCSGGSCVSCLDECVVGFTQCNGDTVQDCSDCDADTCNEYCDTVTDCSLAGEVCVLGACIPCSDECMIGDLGCNGDIITDCGECDLDTCTEYCDTATDCMATGDNCSAGVCAPCTNECAAIGDTDCLGDSIITCGNYDGDPCLEYAPTFDCSSTGLTCDNGSGSGVCVCTHECAGSDPMSCNGNIVEACSDCDADPCLESCQIFNCGASGGTCSGGTCTGSTCTAGPNIGWNGTCDQFCNAMGVDSLSVSFNAHNVPCSAVYPPCGFESPGSCVPGSYPGCLSTFGQTPASANNNDVIYCENREVNGLAPPNPYDCNHYTMTGCYCDC